MAAQTEVTAEKPSWFYSMTSQLMFLATISQLGLGFWLMKRGNTEAAIALVGGAFTTIKGMFDQRKFVENHQAGNGNKPDPIASVDPTKPKEPKP